MNHFTAKVKGCLHGRRKILEGGKTFRWVRMQNFRSMWCPSWEGIKDDRRQQQKCNLDPSALFTGINREIKSHVYEKQQTSDIGKL